MRRFARTPGLSWALLFTIALGIGSNAAINGFVHGLQLRNYSPLAGKDDIVSLFRTDARGMAGPLTFAEYDVLQRRRGEFEWLGAACIRRTNLQWKGQESVWTVAEVTPELANALGLPAGLRTDLPGVEGLYTGEPIDIWEPLTRTPEPESRNVWVIGLRKPGGAALPEGFLVLPFTGMTPQTAEGYNRAGLVLWIAAGAVFFIAIASAASFLLGRATARSHETSLRLALGASQSQLIRQLLADSLLLAAVGGLIGTLIAYWTSRIVPYFLFAEDAERLIFAPAFSTVAGASAVCILLTILCGLLPVLAIPQANPAAVLRRESTGPSPWLRRVRTGIVVCQLACCCALATSTAFLMAGLRNASRTSAGRVLGNPILATVHAHPDAGPTYFARIEGVAKSIPAVRGTAWVGVPPGGRPAWRTFRIEPRQMPLREVSLQMIAFSPAMTENFRLPPSAGRMFGAEDQGCRTAVVNEAAAATLFGARTPGRALWDAGGEPLDVLGVVAMRKAPGPPTIYYYEGPGGAGAGRFKTPVDSELLRVELSANVVSPGYFESMGGRLIAGRMDGVCRTALVNREAAELYFGGHATGAAVIDNNGRRTQIVGVIETEPLGAFQRREDPGIYFPMARDWLPRMTILLQTEQADLLLDEVRRRFLAVDGAGPIPMVVKTLENQLGETSFATLRIVTLIAAASTGVALLLGLVGLFGVLSDSARQRSRELAIRIALGARRRNVAGHILRDGGRVAVAGSLGGIAGSLLLARLLAPMTPAGYSPAPWVWLAGPSVLIGTVIAASILPALKASMANPLVLFRDQN